MNIKKYTFDMILLVLILAIIISVAECWMSRNFWIPGILIWIHMHLSFARMLYYSKKADAKLRRHNDIILKELNPELYIDKKVEDWKPYIKNIDYILWEKKLK